MSAFQATTPRPAAGAVLIEMAPLHPPPGVIPRGMTEGTQPPCAETATLTRAHVYAGIRANAARQDRQECRRWIGERFDRLDNLAWATVGAVATTVLGVVLLLHGGGG